jgi:hypothetical protein
MRLKPRRRVQAKGFLHATRLGRRPVPPEMRALQRVAQPARLRVRHGDEPSGHETISLRARTTACEQCINFFELLNGSVACVRT